LIIKGDVSNYQVTAQQAYEEENSTTKPYWDNMFQVLILLLEKTFFPEIIYHEK